MDVMSAFISENVESSSETDEKTQVASNIITTSSSDTKVEETSVAGTLLLGGSIDFDNMTGKPEGLESYHVIDLGQPVLKTFSSSSSMHLFIKLLDGTIYSMGSNTNGQLGVGDLETRQYPIRVNLPISSEVVKIACGRFHTLVLFSNGEVWGCGLNKSGQLGLGDGKIVQGNIKSFAKVPLREIVDIDAGYEHSIACDRSGKMYTWGSPQFGQLGHGTTGEYLKEGGKGRALQYNNVTSPRQVIKAVTKDGKGKVIEEINLAEVRICMVAAGKNHSMCVEEWNNPGAQNRCFTWGTGGYGRLGHSAPDDELVPREVIHFSPHVVNGEFKLNPTRQIRQLVGGSTCSVAVTLTKQVYFWGKLSNSSRGESTMYPKLVDDLYNWKASHISCGSNMVVVAADSKVIAWGVSVAGQIGFEGGVKGSVPPKFLSALDGNITLQMSCGYGHLCFIVEPNTEPARQQLDSFPRLQNLSVKGEVEKSVKKRTAKADDEEKGTKKKGKGK